jgi:signal transduction histidine kinase
MTTSLAAAAVVAVALAAAGLLLSLLLRHSLTNGVEGAARQRAADLAATIRSDGPDAASALPSREGTSLVQVLRGDAVVASSPDLSGAGPITSLRPAPGRTVTVHRVRLPTGSEDAHALVATGVRTRDGTQYVVVVAQSLDAADTGSQALASLLWIGIPALVVVVGATTFLVAGRALRPVESIRRRVAGIDGAQLGARVPVPPAGDEVGRLAQTMNDMLQRLDDAAAAQRRFVADASHELRSPLATVRTSVEVAQAHPEVTDWRSVGDIVLGETERLQALVSDLLLLTRADESGLHMRRTEVDLDDLCEAEAARLRHLGIDVAVQIRPVRVTGDRDQLARLLRNIVDNAARHAATQVRVSCRLDATSAVIEVVDDGPGVPAADRDRVFERFVRLDAGRARSQGGTGLGLAIALQIAHAHGGDIRFVDPDILPGAKAVVTLPLPDEPTRRST